MVFPFLPHPTLWPHVKRPFSLARLQPYWPLHWTQKVHPETRPLPLLYPWTGYSFYLAAPTPVSTCLAYSFSSSKCLLLTFYQAGLFDLLYQNKTPNMLLISLTSGSLYHLSLSKILYLLIHCLIVFLKPPFPSHTVLPVSCFLNLWSILTSATKSRCKAGL